jgi:ABC-type polysaccharide/polyol phosphate transport system ATPase subunit
LVKSTGTVVLVSHSFGLMKEICDRLVFIHKGQIIGVGKPEEMIKLYYSTTGEE